MEWKPSKNIEASLKVFYTTTYGECSKALDLCAEFRDIAGLVAITETKSNKVVKLFFYA